VLRDKLFYSTANFYFYFSVFLHYSNKRVLRFRSSFSCSVLECDRKETVSDEEWIWTHVLFS